MCLLDLGVFCSDIVYMIMPKRMPLRGAFLLPPPPLYLSTPILGSEYIVDVKVTVDGNNPAPLKHYQR